MIKGVKQLQSDVLYCATHNCRPAKYAEHASTAADFFFQVSAFEEAEHMLDGAIQVPFGSCSLISRSRCVSVSTRLERPSHCRFTVYTEKFRRLNYVYRLLIFHSLYRYSSFWRRVHRLSGARFGSRYFTHCSGTFHMGPGITFPRISFWQT